MQQKVRTEDAKESTVRSLFFVCEYPLQRSCLENPRDRGAWWAAVYWVAQSQTRLKQLSSSSSSNSNSRKIYLRGVKACQPKDAKRRAPQLARERVCEKERERPLALLFMFFFIPLGLPYANWAQPGVLFYLKSSLWSSDLILTFLCSIFAGFSLPRLLATAILDSFSLFYLPNKTMLESTFVLVTFV